MTLIKSENIIRRTKNGLLYFGKVGLTLQLTENKKLEIHENYNEKELSNFSQGHLISLPKKGFELWKQGIKAGIECAYEKLNHQYGLKVIIENAEGLITDTNPTIIGFSAYNAILEKLPNSESKNEREELEKLVFSSWNYSHESIPDFKQKRIIGIKNSRNIMEILECNLNIRYDLPTELLDKVPLIYQKMTGWLGFGKEGKGENGIPYWFSYDTNEKSILASMEPNGIHFVAKMELNEWVKWKTEIKRIATETLGFKVGEIEEGEVGHEIEWITKPSNSNVNKTVITTVDKKNKWWEFWKN